MFILSLEYKFFIDTAEYTSAQLLNKMSIKVSETWPFKFVQTKKLAPLELNSFNEKVHEP